MKARVEVLSALRTFASCTSRSSRRWWSRIDAKPAAAVAVGGGGLLVLVSFQPTRNGEIQNFGQTRGVLKIGGGVVCCGFGAADDGIWGKGAVQLYFMW